MKLKCRNCNHEFEIDEDDLDVDCDVDKLEKDSVEITITIAVKCPKCGRRVLEGSETVVVPFRIRGEASES
ncbi:MAG: hypothetical protein GXO23_01560 [Crenarchaeota archaeon]|nr:hypothetical protein [Thermoproteota archaeon]